MSAKTRQPNDSILARLATLYNAAIYLISEGRRSKRQVDALLKALQFFKEDCLGAVWSNDSAEMKWRRRRNRLDLYQQLSQKYPRKDWGNQDLAECTGFFNFSQRINASFFTGGLDPFRILLRIPEHMFRDNEEVQEIIREIKEKIEPYGLYFGMTVQEIDEAFGPPPLK